MARKPKSSNTEGPLTRLSPAAARLLERVVAGTSEGAAEATDELEQRGLVARGAGGGLVATEAGRARIARSGPEGFLAQHRTLGTRAPTPGEQPALVDLDESPLAWLARRKGRDGVPLLGPDEVLAGERLRADFTRGQMAPRVTANWEATVSRGRRGGAGTAVDLSDAAVAARQRVSRALEAVGPELSGALVDVCCFLKGMAEVERDRGWPARGAKLVLGLALARLARHYGYGGEGEARRPEGRITNWRAPGARPTIDGAAPDTS